MRTTSRCSSRVCVLRPGDGEGGHVHVPVPVAGCDVDACRHCHGSRSNKAGRGVPGLLRDRVHRDRRVRGPSRFAVRRLRGRRRWPAGDRRDDASRPVGWGWTAPGFAGGPDGPAGQPRRPARAGRTRRRLRAPLAVRGSTGVTGRVTGDPADVPCGARMASKCKPCAERNRRLRQRQIREGWHLTEEPVVPVEQPDSEVLALLRLRGEFLFERDDRVRDEDWDQVRDLDQGIAEVDDMLVHVPDPRHPAASPGKERKPRTVRSTKRRQDAPKLPRRKVENRTVGRVVPRPRPARCTSPRCC